MKIETGYLYHIKDEFFDIVNDSSLMINHENGGARPTYFTIREKEILWFIPLSRRVSKYKPIVEKKMKKYGSCKTILIRTILKKENVILLQNAFPTLEKYIDHPHLENGVPVKVSDKLKKEILSKFKSLLVLKAHGLNLFFSDVDRIKKIMFEEIEKDK